MNLHMKTTNQVYGDFEYVSGNYRNMNQPICMTTVPMVVNDAYRHWKREWLPTINHDYGHFYRVLAERRRSQKMKTPDAWSYNIHLGTTYRFCTGVNITAFRQEKPRFPSIPLSSFLDEMSGFFVVAIFETKVNSQ